MYCCSSSFPTDRFKVVPLLQLLFICSSVISYVAFVMSLVVLQSGSFVSSGGMCFVIVAFPGYLHLYIGANQPGICRPEAF